MTSFVIFRTLDRLYGIDIECVKRILPSQFLTAMPDEGNHIEGMFKYEDEIIKVLSFRKVIGVKSYVEQLHQMFPELQAQHKEWLDALNESVDKGVPFTKTTNPHACSLGKWIDSFHPDDNGLLEVMKHLNYHHQRLHQSAINVLDERATDPQKAKKRLETDVQDIYQNTSKYLSDVSILSEKVAATLQRCLILMGEDNNSFGMNIDEVEDILHIDEEQLHRSKELQPMGDFMNIAGILEHDGKLITIIKDVTIKKRSA